MILSELLEENVQKYGEYPFLYFGENEHSNIEIQRQANQFAAVLNQFGIGNGNRVVVCMPNCPEVIVSYQGIARAGAVTVPVLFVLHAKEIEFIVKNSEAKAIVTSEELLPKITEALCELKERPKLFVVSSNREGSQSNAILDQTDVNALRKQDIYNFHDTISSVSDKALNQILKIMKSIQEHDPAVILYTSGTTGKPKGVILTHRNLYSNAKSSAESSDGERGTTLGVLPLAHVYGFTVTNICCLLGSSIVIFNRFQVEAVFRAIEKYKVKTFSAVPAMIHALVTSPIADQFDLSSLESVGSGSAPLPLGLIETFRNRFHAEVYEGYGLSEAAPIVSAHRKGMLVKPGSVGTPLKGIEVKIVDDLSKELPTGEVGELIVRGPNISPGYLNNPEASAQTMRDGWLYTGDFARMDEDGYLYIVDRKKDLIIRGGFNIYPRELEELLVKHEAVSEAAVLGITSERMGEEVVAYVVQKPGTNVTEQELIQFCGQHVAKYKTPRRVLFVDQLPRNGVGKILKQRLRDMAQDLELFL
jgi:long-chain acyl-CoA synthetase